MVKAEVAKKILWQARVLEIMCVCGKSLPPQALKHELNSWPCIYDGIRD